MDCSKRFGLAEYVNEIDETIWKKIASRPCDRA
jgi:hypothetical protein